jgi:hypothetical protein
VQFFDARGYLVQQHSTSISTTMNIIVQKDSPIQNPLKEENESVVVAEKRIESGGSEREMLVTTLIGDEKTKDDSALREIIQTQPLQLILIDYILLHKTFYEALLNEGKLNHGMFRFHEGIRTFLRASIVGSSGELDCEDVACKKRVLEAENLPPKLTPPIETNSREYLEAKKRVYLFIMHCVCRYLAVVFEKSKHRDDSETEEKLGSCEIEKDGYVPMVLPTERMRALKRNLQKNFYPKLRDFFFSERFYTFPLQSVFGELKAALVELCFPLVCSFEDFQQFVLLNLSVERGHPSFASTLQLCLSYLKY